PGYAGGAGKAGFSPQLAAGLGRLPSVGVAAGVNRGSVLLNGQAQTIAAVDPDRIGSVLNLGVTAGSLGAVDSGSFAVSAAAAADQHWRVGSRVPVVYPDGTRARLRVAAVFDHPDVTGDYLFAAAGWAPHAGQPLDSMVLLKLRPGAPLGPARAEVTAATAAAGQPRAQYQASATSGVNTILGLVYVMLALAILIALMGVANTLSLSIHERTRELGLLRALGQSRAQTRGMVRWESVIIAVFGTLGGVILGTFLGWAVVRS